MVTSDQPCFDTGTSTRGLSTGVTVGGTGSSLVQTTGAAAQRVHLPEVTVTIETLISPVQNFGPVPVLSRLPVGSQKSSKGYRFKQDYRLHRVAGGEIQQGYWLRRIAGSGTRVMPVLEPECCWLQRNLLFSSFLQGTSLKSSADNRFTGYRGFPVTEN